MEHRSSKVIVVVGPTASGKSDFAVELAKKINGEIISADSRQVFKGLDLGTGKITKTEMQGVPHHMLSVYSLDEDISVSRFAEDALPILNDILSKEKTAIICGGTGQYIDALIYQHSVPRVPPNHVLRKELEKKSTEELFNELEKKDPRRAADIDRHNRVRLIRALEIINSLIQVPLQAKPLLRHPTTIYLLTPSRDLLKKRIELRLDKRLTLGMEDEVRDILKRGYRNEKLKKFGLEYVVLGEYIEGRLSLQEAKEMLLKKTFAYAKRQETWNKKYEKDAIIIPVV